MRCRPTCGCARFLLQGCSLASGCLGQLIGDPRQLKLQIGWMGISTCRHEREQATGRAQTGLIGSDSCKVVLNVLKGRQRGRSLQGTSDQRFPAMSVWRNSGSRAGRMSPVQRPTSLYAQDARRRYLRPTRPKVPTEHPTG